MPDSAHASFWDARYSAEETPWDADGVPAALKAFADNRPPSARVLIPGCGSGHEAAYLLARRWDVLAIDFSPAAIARAAALLGLSSFVLREADFFGLPEEPFDVIYERAFLCALPPRIWPAYGEQMARLTRPGGLLAGYFFLAETRGGPPFGASQEDLEQLLGDAFQRVVDDPVSDSLPVFAGRERWQIWQRLDEQRLQTSPETRGESPD
jgi:SAM-dependent methyltransferase